MESLTILEYAARIITRANSSAIDDKAFWTTSRVIGSIDNFAIYYIFFKIIFIYSSVNAYQFFGIIIVVSYSSIRYKKDVEPLSSAVDTISKLQGVSYSWKDTGKKDFGFIAEEVGKVIPEIVEWSADPQYANTMDYTRIISFLVEAVKEQQKKIDILTERLDKIDV